MIKVRDRILGLAVCCACNVLLAQTALVDGKNAYKPVPEADAKKLEAAAPAKASAIPQKERKVLIFQKTSGWLPPAIMMVDDAFKIMGKKSGAFEVDAITDDAAVMTPEWLNRFDLVVLNNTNELKLDGAQTQALQDFIRGGKGVFALGSAISVRYWAEEAEMLGGYCYGHPWKGLLTIKVEDPCHPLTRMFDPKGIKLTDVIYQVIGPYSRTKTRVLLSLDVTDPAVGDQIASNSTVVREDRDFAVSWVRDHGKGRVFVTLLTHVNHQMLFEPAILQHFLDGAQFAMGDLHVDTTPIPAKEALRIETKRAPADPKSIETLLERIQNKNWNVPETAIRAVVSMSARPETKNAVSALAQLLRGESTFGDNQRTIMAFSAMGANGRPAVSTLLELLKDSNEVTRGNAVLAMGGIGTAAEATIPAVARMIQDAASYPSACAVLALGKMGSAAVATLTKTAEDKHLSWLLRMYAAESLGTIGFKVKGVVPALKAALEDDDPDVQRAAKRALGTTTTKEPR